MYECEFHIFCGFSSGLSVYFRKSSSQNICLWYPNSWINHCSPIDERVIVGSCKIYRLLFAVKLLLLASYEQCLQHVLDRFAAVFNQAGKHALKYRGNTFLQESSQSTLQVSGNTL